MVLKVMKSQSIETNTFHLLTKKKNMSTFLKMLIFVRHKGIQTEVINIFSLKMENLLLKKKDKI
jgi:hypothetical protein